ncbi:hypothetical protein HY641_04955 [Candidatus Woesearchaeota archaeon]|nr:hypothetical protein [Candidatus Woesearchaeota archaeon]
MTITRQRRANRSKRFSRIALTLGFGSLLSFPYVSVQNALTISRIIDSGHQSLDLALYNQSFSTFAFGRQRDTTTREVVLYNPSPHTLTPPSESEQPVFLDPQSTFLIATTSKNPVIYDLPSGKRTPFLLNASYTTIAHSPGLEALIFYKAYSSQPRGIYHRSGKLLRPLSRREKPLCLPNHILIRNETENKTDVRVLDTTGERHLTTIDGLLVHAWETPDGIYIHQGPFSDKSGTHSIQCISPTTRTLFTFPSLDTAFIKDNLLITLVGDHISTYALHTGKRIATLQTTAAPPHIVNISTDPLPVLVQDRGNNLYIITQEGIKQSHQKHPRLEALIGSTQAIVKISKETYEALASHDISTGKTTPLPTPWQPCPPGPLQAVLPSLLLALGATSLVYGMRFPKETRKPLPTSLAAKVLSAPIDIVTEHPLCASLAVLATDDRFKNIYNTLAHNGLFTTLRVCGPDIISCCLISGLMYALANIFHSLRKPRLVSFAHVCKSLTFRNVLRTSQNTLTYLAVDDQTRERINALLALPTTSDDTYHFLDHVPTHSYVPVMAVVLPLFIATERRSLRQQFEAEPTNLAALLSLETLAVQTDDTPGAVNYATQALAITQESPSMLLLQGRLLSHVAPNLAQNYISQAATKLLEGATRHQILGEASHLVFTVIGTAYTSRTFAFKEHPTLEHALTEHDITMTYNDALNTDRIRVAESIGVISSQNKHYLVTTYLPGPTLFELIHSTSIQAENYTRCIELLAELHAVRIDGSPRDLHANLAQKLTHLPCADTYLDAFADTQDTLARVPWRPNQDYHPMNIIDSEGTCLKLDQGSAGSLVPATFDIASLILFDPRIDSYESRALTTRYCAAVGEKQSTDNHIRALIPSLFYRALYMSSIWQNRDAHRHYAVPVLTNAARLIDGLANNHHHRHCASLLLTRAQSLT